MDGVATVAVSSADLSAGEPGYSHNRFCDRTGLFEQSISIAPGSIRALFADHTLPGCHRDAGRGRGHLEGQLTATLMADEQDIRGGIRNRCVDTVQDICRPPDHEWSLPTGVRVGLAMQHGGTFPGNHRQPLHFGRGGWHQAMGQARLLSELVRRSPPGCTKGWQSPEHLAGDQ